MHQNCWEYSAAADDDDVMMRINSKMMMMIADRIWLLMMMIADRRWLLMMMMIAEAAATLKLGAARLFCGAAAIKL